MKNYENPTLKQAIRESLRECRHWMGGAVIQEIGEGEYVAVPGAYLSDISYNPRGCRVVGSCTHPSDWLGNEWQYESTLEENIADDEVIEAVADSLLN